MSRAALEQVVAPIRPAPSGVAAGPIRPFSPDDIPAVARLFQKVFRKIDSAPPHALEECLEDLFVQDPWTDPDLPSRVYLRPDGAVGGFIGALPVRMSLRGRPLRAVVASTLMVENARQNPFAGAGLLRSLLSGPQDLSLSDTASPSVRAMWIRLGGVAAAGHSMDWWRVLRPAGFGSFLLGRKHPSARLLGPAARVADAALTALGLNPFRLEERHASVQSEEVEEGVFATELARLSRRYALRPDWDAAALRHRLRHCAERNSDSGIVRRVVYGKRVASVGCYLYEGRRNGVARVLELASEPGACEAVLQDLLTHAASAGTAAVRGPAQRT